MFSKKFLTGRNILSTLLLVLIIGFVTSSRFLPAQNQSQDIAFSEQGGKQEEVRDQTEVQEPAFTGNSDSAQLTNHLVKGSSTQIKQTPPVGGPTSTVQNPQQQTTKPVEATVTLNINTGANNYSYKIIWVDGMTVWEVLEKAKNENGFEVIATWHQGFKSYYVTGIHNRVCECWTYDVNGSIPPLGASVVKVKENDIITWKAS